mgnify:CR=1 FL=1
MATFDELQSAIDQVREQRAALDGQYDRQRAEIVDQYQLSETPQERKSLERLLDRLDQEREQSIEQLRAGYNEARGQILERAQSASGAGQEEVERLASGFERAYTQIRAEEEATAQQYSRAGIPVNVGGATDTGMDEVLASQAAAMGEAATARNAITQEDIEWLADSMLAERQASVADAGQIATRVGGAAESAHNRAVQQRIAQERAQRAAALQSLMTQFNQRRDSLGGREGDLLTQLAQMREQRRQFEAQLAEQRAARQAAAARARSSGGGGGGRSSGGGSGGPSASGTNLSAEELEDLKWTIRDENRRENSKGVNLSPGYGGLPRNVGVSRGQGYLVGGSGSTYSGGGQWDKYNNTPRGR